MDELTMTPPVEADRTTVSAMRERVELLELAESLAAVGHWQVDLKAGQLFWSDEIYRIHGVSRDTYTPELESAIDFYHPDDASRVAAYVDRAISDRRPFEFRFRIVRPSGEIRHVESRARVRLDADGETDSIFGVFQDITDRLRTKEALRESQQRFELAVRGSNAGLWYWQIQTEELFWSPRYLEMMGLIDESFRPTFAEFGDRLHPADQDLVLAAMTAHLKKRVPFDVEYRVRHEDGSYIWLHARGQAEWDASGTPTRMAGSVEDVTARRREQSFREAVYAVLTTPDVGFDAKISEMLTLGRVYLNLSTGVVCSHRDGQVAVEFSSDMTPCGVDNAAQTVAARFLPITLERDTMITHADLTPAEWSRVSADAPAVSRAHYVGIPLRINGRVYGSLSFFSQSVGKRDFQTHETSFVPVLARLLCYELSQREILSQAHEARADVERQQAELDRILNTVPVRIWYKDDKNGILRLNEKAADSMGMTIEDATGANTYDLFPAMAKKYHEDDLRVIESGRPELGIVEQYTPRDGARGWISTDKIPFDDPVTGESRLLVVSQDITPVMSAQRSLERQAQELRQTNRDLDHFAYVASHDLRAPMRGIEQLASWIEEDLGESIDEDVRAKLQLMQKRVSRMDRMLQDMLTFARAGKRDEREDLLDVRAVLKEVIAWLAPPPGIKVLLNIDSLTVRMSRTVFEQLFLNLIGNAIKHHDRTHGDVEVSAQLGASHVEFCVRDDGPGIHEGYQQKIFEMFSTLKRRDEREGSGIGLAIVQRVARAYGGVVTVNSPLTDRGTEFRILLPASIASMETHSDSVS